jgi:hypothetical protein
MSALILVQSPPVPLILIVVLPTVAPMMLTVAPGAAALVGLPATVAFAVPVGVAVIVAGVTGVQLPKSQDLRCNVAVTATVAYNLTETGLDAAATVMRQ